MKTMKLYIALTLSIGLITSCTSYKEVKIINDCNSKIDMFIQFDKDFMNFLFSKKESQVKFVDQITLNKKIERVSFDQENLIVKYVINSKDTLVLNAGVEIKNDFIFLIKELTLIRDIDTLYIKDDNISDIFIDSKKELQEFEIKDGFFENK